MAGFAPQPHSTSEKAQRQVLSECLSTLVPQRHHYIDETSHYGTRSGR